MLKEYKNIIQQGNCSSLELTLLGICLVFFGIIVGMIICPAKFWTFGSFNGNSGSLTAPEKISLGKKKHDESSSEEE